MSACADGPSRASATPPAGLIVTQLKPCSQSASARERAYGRPSGGFTRSGRRLVSRLGAGASRSPVRANEFAAGKSRSPPARTVRHGRVPRHRQGSSFTQLKPCSQSASARDRAYRSPGGGFTRSGRKLAPWLDAGAARSPVRANEFAAGKSRSPPARTVRHGRVPRHRRSSSLTQLKPCSQSASARDRAYRFPSGGFSRSGRMRAPWLDPPAHPPARSTTARSVIPAGRFPFRS
jgi:hypothetical protein